MKRYVWLAVCGLGCFSVSMNAVAERCGDLAALVFPGGSITMVSLELPGTITGLAEKPIKNLPAFCRVAATLTPTSDSKIRIEVWLPASGWNGRFMGTGNGGYASTIGYGGLAGALRNGYAAATTDMGTSLAAGENADALAGHPERWRDWGVYPVSNILTESGHFWRTCAKNSAPFMPGMRMSETTTAKGRILQLPPIPAARSALR